MTNKDVDFAKVSLPVDEFDAMMRRALDAPPPIEKPKEAEDRDQPKPRGTKTKAES